MEPVLHKQYIDEFMQSIQMDLYRISLFLKENTQKNILDTIFLQSPIKNINSLILYNKSLLQKYNKDLVNSALRLSFNQKDFVISRELTNLTKWCWTKEQVFEVGDKLMALFPIIIKNTTELYERYKNNKENS